MNLIFTSNLKAQKGLTYFEKLFVANYYASGNQLSLNKNEDKKKKINNDILDALSGLYDLVNQPNAFKISIEDNPYLNREFENELLALEARGNHNAVNTTKQNKQKVLEGMARHFSSNLYEEYKHIVDMVKNSHYPDAFKFLILNETLSKIYKMENGKIISTKREMNKSITGHMSYSNEILDYIYENITQHTNFSRLYFDALENSKNKMVSLNQINIEGVNTFSKGRWIKFPSRQHDYVNFQRNVDSLKTLVSDTNWCTKSLASSHLSMGDFYVFVDNDNKPHLAVRMSWASIDEVRGIEAHQRIEPYYEDVMREFLTKNKDVANGEIWLEEQENNVKLDQYCELIENKIPLSIEDKEEIIKLLNHREYRSHGGFNNHKAKLLTLISEDELLSKEFNEEQFDNIQVSDYIKEMLLYKSMDTIETKEELLAFFASIYNDDTIDRYSYRNRNAISKMCHCNQIIEKLQTDKFVKIIQELFKCNKEDIVFLTAEYCLDGKKSVTFKNKVVIGDVCNSSNELVNFEAKAIMGMLYAGRSIECPNLIYVPQITTTNAKYIKMDKLKKCDVIKISGESVKVVMSSLVLGGNIDFRGIKYLDISSLRQALNMSIIDCKVIISKSLTRVKKMYLHKIKSAKFNELEKAKILEIKECGSIEALGLVEAEDLIIDNCNEIVASSLKRARNMHIKKCLSLNIENINDIINDMEIKQTTFKNSTPYLNVIGNNADFSGSIGFDLSSLSKVGGYLALIHSIFSGTIDSKIEEHVVNNKSMLKEKRQSLKI